MGVLVNCVTAGDYKGADIKAKGMKSDKPVLIKKGLLGKTEILLDKSSVQNIEEISKQDSVGSTITQIAINFKNGKRSLATVDGIVLRAITSKLF